MSLTLWRPSQSGQTGKDWQQITITLKLEETQFSGPRRKGRLERLFVHRDKKQEQQL